MKISRRGLVLGLAAASVALPSLSPSRSAAQTSIPDGVFVRESSGTVWLVLKGQRVAVAMWPTSDADVAALPVSDQWAVLSVTDPGAIVGGGKPAWYVDAAPSTMASTTPPATSTPTIAPAVAGPPAQPATSGQLVITAQTTWTEKMFNSTYVVGAIENQAVSPLAVKTIAVSLLGPGGETVGSANALYSPSFLKPGARAYWSSLVSNAPAFSDVRVQIESAAVDNRFSETIQDFRADGVTAQGRRPAIPKLVGQVVNISDKTTGSVQVIGATFGPDGKLLDVHGSYSRLDTMAPGQSAPFEISFLNPAVQDASRYELYLQARVKR